MAASASTAVLFPLKALRRVLGWALLLAVGGFLVLFGLQFSHAPKLDTLWVVIQLRQYGDPLLKSVGPFVGVAWPAEPSYSFLPLVLALAAWGLKVGSDAGFLWLLKTVDNLLTGKEKKEAEEEALIPGLSGMKADSKRSREELLKRYRELESALKSSKRKRCAFLSTDVVGSTKMKDGEQETDIAATFQAYEELLKHIFEEHGAWKVAWTPDGVMVCFLQVDLAVAAGQAVLKGLKEFNTTENRLRTSFRVRCGLNEGEVAIYEDSKLEKVVDHVIDVAGHMQKQAAPNTLWLGAELYNLMGDKSSFYPTGKAVDGLEVYEWSAEPRRRRAEVDGTGGGVRRPPVVATLAGAPAVASADAEARRIGRYEVIGELGRGAMGAVYKARDPQIGRTVAVKMIVTGNQTSEELEEYKRRFFREAQTAGQMSHPGIVTIYDVNEDEDGQPYLVMEFIEGATLEKLLASAGPGRTSVAQPLSESIDIAIQVADALDYAHRRNVIHRDIKPANILVTPEGKAKIADFGIAKMVGTQMTHTGLLVGTPAFMSPEQITGGQIDARSDIFSFGIVLYWMCTGTKPFAGQAITEVAYKVVHATPTPVRQLNADLPYEMEVIIARCLAKKPDERYQRGRDLANDLENLKARQRVSAAPLPTTPASTG
ncbi:MAG: protein kinase [Acidobacteriia bacterium]|nr:protein kinase [Terriglobia bacterium]